MKRFGVLLFGILFASLSAASAGQDLNAEYEEKLYKEILALTARNDKKVKTDRASEE